MMRLAWHALSPVVAVPGRRAHVRVARRRAGPDQPGLSAGAGRRSGCRRGWRGWRGEGDEAAPVPALVEAPYDDALNRLAEITGALFHLETICEPGEEAGWLQGMEALLAAQDFGETRRARLVASFNAGYRGFAATHTRCTEASRAATRLFATEGARLTADLAARFGG